MRVVRSLSGLLAGSVVVIAAWGCGGTTESAALEPGGTIVDSGLPDGDGVDAALTNDGGVDGAEVDSGADAEPDSSVDAAPDQSVEEAAVPDAEPAEASLFDLTMPDVALNDSGATAQACYDCAAVQCETNMAECEQDEACRTLVLCLFTDGCIDGSGMGGLNTDCATSCFQQSGISGFNDPAVQVAYGVAMCVNSSCKPECGLP